MTCFKKKKKVKKLENQFINIMLVWYCSNVCSGCIVLKKISYDFSWALKNNRIDCLKVTPRYCHPYTGISIYGLCNIILCCKPDVHSSRKRMYYVMWSKYLAFRCVSLHELFKQKHEMTCQVILHIFFYGVLIFPVVLFCTHQFPVSAIW